MKRVEDAFQELASKIVDGTVSEITDADQAVISKFWALWRARAERRHLPEQEIQAIGITGGGGLTRDQEEMLEKNGYSFMRAGGKVPARDLNGSHILFLFRDHASSLSSARWGIVRAHEGEFLVPDIPADLTVPLNANALCNFFGTERNHHQAKCGIDK